MWPVGEQVVGAEDPLWHQCDVFNDRLKIHAGQNVALYVDPRSYFDEFDALGVSLKTARSVTYKAVRPSFNACAAENVT